MHTTSLDIDRLCDLFNSKAKVSKSKGKADLAPIHPTAYKVDDDAVVQLSDNFEEAKQAVVENVRPRRNLRKDSNIRKIGAKSTTKAVMKAQYLSVPLPASPRRTTRSSVKK
jgi:hypothetical protein